MSGAAAAAVGAPDLVKAVDAAVKAATANESGRAVDSLHFLAKQEVTAGLLLSTGAGKKVGAAFPSCSNAIAFASLKHCQLSCTVCDILDGLQRGKCCGVTLEHQVGMTLELTACRSES